MTSPIQEAHIFFTPFSDEAERHVHAGTETTVSNDIELFDGGADETTEERHRPASDSGHHVLRWLSSAHSTDFKAHFYQCLLFVLPSFVQARLTQSRSLTLPKKLHSTSHLDGVRGLAALFVCVYHLSYVIYPTGLGFHSGDADENRHLIQLPIVSLFYTGSPWVGVFFVVSGYSLSVKPLKQMHSGAWDDLHATISSAVFRRGFRLFLPVLASTWLIMWLLNFGFYEVTREYALSDEYLRNWREVHALKSETWYAQLKNWYHISVAYIWVWSFDLYEGTNWYDIHLWTITVEYRCSLVLFLVQSALSRVRTPIRLLSLILINWWALQWARWDVCLFLAGTMLAEYDLVSKSYSASGCHSQAESAPETYGLRFWLWHVSLIGLFILGLYLLAFPEFNATSTPGYVWLANLVPDQFFTEQPRFWPSFGAVIYIFSINNVRMLAAFYNLAPIQYLGRISFALYLMHSPVIHIFGYWLEQTSFRVVFGFTREDVYGAPFNTVFVACAVLTLGACIWAGDIFWRAVDLPSIKFARWLEGKCLIRNL